MNPDRRLVAILFADIQGYTAMMQENESRALDILDRYETVLENNVQQYQGEIIKSFGDGTICVFNSAIGAINCAIQIQETLIRNDGAPLRIGVHLGDVTFKKGDIYGDALNIASRIESTAIPGSVLVSRDLYDKVKSQGKFAFKSLGNLKYKNVQDSIEVLAVSSNGLTVPARRQLKGKLSATQRDSKRLLFIAAISFVVVVGSVWFQITREEEPDRKQEMPADSEGNAYAIAVLPFENIGQDGTASFADGIHSDLLTSVSKMADLKVISRSTVMRYRDSDKSLPAIAEELDVKWILTGDVEEVTREVQVNVRLIDANEDRQKWAESFRRELTGDNIFDIQAEISEVVASELIAQFGSGESLVPTSVTTADMEAYRDYLQGKFKLDQRTETAMREALTLFEQAIDRDSSYALAWVGKADAITLLVNYGYSPRNEELPKAFMAAQTALSLDAQLPEAHGALGLIYSDMAEGVKAEAALIKAIELQANYADAFNWLSWVQLLIGKPEEAAVNAIKGIEINPLAPECIGKVFWSYMTKGDYLSALYETEKMIRISEEFTTAYLYKAMALYHLERYDETLETLKELEVPWSGAAVPTMRGLCHYSLGNTAEFNKILLRLESDKHDFGRALLLSAKGDYAQANNLIKSIQVWDFWPTLSMYYMFPNELRVIRNNPNYNDVIAKVRQSWGAR